MAGAKLVKIGFRIAVLIGICVLGFYIGRPLYWKVSATLQEIREKDYTQEAVKQGFNDLMAEAQRSVGWGPGATIKFEEERAIKQAERKKQIEMARPKAKSKTPKQDALLLSEPTKVAQGQGRDQMIEELKETKLQSKSFRRLLLL